LLGVAVHPIIVKPKLKEIFKIRTTNMIAMFGAYNS